MFLNKLQQFLPLLVSTEEEFAVHLIVGLQTSVWIRGGIQRRCRWQVQCMPWGEKDILPLIMPFQMPDPRSLWLLVFISGRFNSIAQMDVQFTRCDHTIS